MSSFFYCCLFFFFSSRRRHTRSLCDWSSDVCSSDLTRGSADHVFLDLHVWLPPDMRLSDAHDLSHTVKDRLTARYPQIADAIIHIEPPPKDGSNATDRM